jgi:predicted Zn-dependent peptidase
MTQRLQIGKLFPILLIGCLACSRPARIETTSFIVDGLQVILKTAGGNPVVAGGFFLLGGTNYTGSQQAGIESFLLEAATQGTASLPKDELNSRIESMGSKFKVAAAHDYNGITFQCIQEHFNGTWEMFIDMLLHPRLEPGDLDLVRERIIGLIESENDQGRKQAYKVANNLFYEGQPYGISVYGNPSSITRYSRKDLLQYHRSDVTKNRALLVLVGDLDQRDITNRARSFARQLPLGPEMRLPGLSFDPGSPDLAVASRNLPRSVIVGMFPAPKPGHPDYPAFTVAMGILSDRLFESMTKDQSLAASPHAGFARRIANHGYIIATTHQPNTCVQTIFQTIDQLVLEPIPENQLHGMLALFNTRHLMDYESAVSQMTQLALWEIVGEGWEQSERYIPEIGALQPTDIQAIVRKYVKNFHFGVVGNPREVTESLFTSR